MFLFTMFFNLLLLPFTLLGLGFRLLFGALGISTRIFLWPLKIFARHTVLCLVVLACVILYYAVKSDPHSLDSLKPAVPEKQPETVSLGGRNGAPLPVVQPVTRTEDGDSDFATDLYQLMTKEERAVYSQNFFAAMSQLKSGETHTWEHYNINGSIRANDLFLNKSGVSCRHFSEALKVHHIQQALTGTACVQTGGSWCKLRPNATPACNLGHQPGMFDGITNAIGGLF